MCKKSKEKTGYSAAQWDRGELRVCIKCKQNERMGVKKGKGGDCPPSRYDRMQQEESLRRAAKAPPAACCRTVCGASCCSLPHLLGR